MRAWTLPLAAAFLTLGAGCLGEGPAPASDASPRAGEVPLVMYAAHSTHDGAHGVELYPNASAPGPAPAWCVAYRANATTRDYSCEVRARPENIPLGAPDEPPHEAPWTLAADWATGSRGAEETVLAYDSTGRVVARWDGEEARLVAYVTE